MANFWYIQVNRLCNNKCHFCSNPNNWRSISYERWVELIDKFIQDKCHWIIFTWWEPTLSKDLPRWIEYCTLHKIDGRIISNGIICSDFNYTKKLKDSWLSLIHFSLYSYIERIHDFLTDNPWSYKKLLHAIQNALKLWINVQINCVINYYNQDHLDKNVIFINKYFPNIKHFVWNNLDPFMMRKTKVALSALPDFEIAWNNLKKAVNFLDSIGWTYRIERLPLCFMEWFEWASTETRAIIKNEWREVVFLDHRKSVRHVWIMLSHNKAPECTDCDLNMICGWICEYNDFYNYVKVKPKKITKEYIINITNKVKNEKSWH